MHVLANRQVSILSGLFFRGRKPDQNSHATFSEPVTLQDSEDTHAQPNCTDLLLVFLLQPI